MPGRFRLERIGLHGLEFGRVGARIADLGLRVSGCKVGLGVAAEAAGLWSRFMASHVTGTL